jgi:ribosomal protein S18 acetylase RimI-like enzyme
VSVRVAGPEDADAVAGLLIEFRDWMGYGTPPDETVRATVGKLLEDPGTVYLLAGDQGLAQLRFRLSAWTGAEDCWLEDLFVSESARGTGLGRALIAECIAHARARGCVRIELDVQADNAPALALYERNGFSTTPKGETHTLFLSRRLE